MGCALEVLRVAERYCGGELQDSAVGSVVEGVEQCAFKITFGDVSI